MKGACLIPRTTLRIADLAANPCDILCLMTAAPCLDTLLQALRQAPGASARLENPLTAPSPNLKLSFLQLYTFGAHAVCALSNTVGKFSFC